MSLPVTLRPYGANLASVFLGKVTIVFSYDTAVAFTNDATGESLVDPTPYSRTTAKHLAETGYKHEPRAASRDAFVAALSEALKGALP